MYYNRSIDSSSLTVLFVHVCGAPIIICKPHLEVIIPILKVTSKKILQFYFQICNSFQ